MSGWDGLVEIFHPEHKHMVDELESKRIVADVPGSEGDPNKTWVDLDRGIVHLALPPERYGSAWSGRPDDESDWRRMPPTRPAPDVTIGAGLAERHTPRRASPRSGTDRHRSTATIQP